MWRNRYNLCILLITGFFVLGLLAGCSTVASTPTETTSEVASVEITISLPGTSENKITVTDEGKLLKNAQITSSDGNISLNIDAGTVLLDGDNKPLQSIIVLTDSTIPVPPENVVMIGDIVEIQPSGAIADPFVRLVLKYNPATIPQGVGENDIWVSYYTGESWEMLRYKNIDTGVNQITTKIDRSGRYAILSPTAPQETRPNTNSTGLLEVLHNGKPTLAEFGSNTCIPCKQMKPILEQLDVDYADQINVVVVEVYEQRDVTQLYRIMTIPTQIIFNNSGIEVARHIGVWPREEIEAELNKLGVQ